MNMLRSVAILLVLLSLGVVSRAQSANPASWTYEVKKKSATDYQLIFHLELKNGWHIWSLKPGGDGFQIVPSFSIDKNAAVQLKGEVKESGHATTSTMDGVTGKVTYLSGKIDYIQNVSVKGAARITGKHTYQICDDKQCLAPVDKDFVFDIK